MAEDRMLSDEVLLALIKKNSGGGGGGGTDNYNDLKNKPQIAGTVLTGNKSLADLGIASATALGTVSDAVTAITDGQTIDSFSDVETALEDKVDVVSGKGLSTNDYTDADKAIVGGVTAALADKVDKVEGKGLSTNDFTDAYKTAIGANTTAISGIKDGADIDSFADVETALDDKADKSAVKNEFIGTTAEWNALTTAQKKAYDTYQITDDYTEGSGGLPDYSTTEQLTGQKWIDGKDIYFKTYNVQLPSAHDVDSNLAFLIDSDVSFIDTLTRADGVIYDQNGKCSALNGGLVGINGWKYGVHITTTQALELFSGITTTEIGGGRAILTIYYTKTA